MPNIFEGKLIRLRAVEPDDWENHARWDRDTDGARLTYEIPFPAIDADGAGGRGSASRSTAASEHIASRSRRWTACWSGHSTRTRLRPTQRHVHVRGGYRRAEHRRKGYAAEAIRLVLRYFFHERRYQKCNAEVYSFNEPSQRCTSGSASRSKDGCGG